MFIVDQPTVERFTVIDDSYNCITGLTDNDFTKKIYNPSNEEVADEVAGSIVDIGDAYALTYTPNATGRWFIIVYHETYFPWGKAAEVQVDAEPVDSDIKKSLWNKKTLEQISDREYVETLFDDDGTTPIRQHQLTKVGGVETREPV